ncbi:MAG: ATP synthase F1 subunit epsilon [Tissierellia bacterium]|nr:ATP synthase F1 subunit epsilon [Bacillota bacterium]NLL23123.1 ATP synthase F1 subunit epsilon [Tissierellia bacterium]
MAKSETRKLELNILTPRGVKFKREADFLAMRAVDGDIGILPNHAPMTSSLGDGILRILNDGEEEKLALFEGVVEIKDNVVNIYTTIAQHPEEIDLERARREKEEAEAALQEEREDFEMQNFLLQIRRALVRLEVGVHSTDIGYFEQFDEEE